MALLGRKKTYLGAPSRQATRRRGAKMLLALLALLLLWVIFMPGRGLLTLLRQRRDLVNTVEENAKLRQQNAQLQQEVERLRSDNAALEHVARSKFGLLKPNEVLYQFVQKAKGATTHDSMSPQDEEQANSPAAPPEARVQK